MKQLQDSSLSSVEEKNPSTRTHRKSFPLNLYRRFLGDTGDTDTADTGDTDTADTGDTDTADTGVGTDVRNRESSSRNRRNDVDM